MCESLLHRSRGHLCQPQDPVLSRPGGGEMMFATLFMFIIHLFLHMLSVHVLCSCYGYFRWCPSNWWTVTRLTTRRRSFSERIQFERFCDYNDCTLTSESTSDVTSLAALRVMGEAGCAPRCQRTGGWSRTVYPGVMEIS